jgi:cytoskeletal protein CcmA (bactofilin family)
LDDGPGPVIFGGSYTVKSGDTVNGDVVVFGGVVLLEEDTVVNGSVVVFGGTLTVNGEVNGDVVLVGGAAALGEESVIDGSLSLVGATLARADGAQVNGEVTFRAHGDFSEDTTERSIPDIPGVPNIPGFERVPVFHNVNPLWIGLGVFGRSLAMALLALLVGLFLEDPTRRVGESIAAQPVIASGLGFLTIILAPAVLVILAITIILAPVALLAVLVLLVAWLYGWIALGFEVGLRFTKMIKQDWALPLTAAFGTWLLTLISASINLVPCVGWLAPFILATLALGGIAMSRFGTRVSLPPAPAAANAPATPATPDPLPPTDGEEEA